ncbi:elongation factor EF-1 gamma subunit [Protomyces lactucae-debilis]|uniref:Elongation factor EF-1 gamma subunit n=1 Tax=Protomyces lactucae-debilis TaxID=2754530 RepID=A0A1Y2FS95_PROLT|nr:elongation factor EF-1 gamma subunit [Protomyces lactucae-debilis]ORY86858.1 elongation factor EF-1 gamma subunit [Protomyces lactucae-debilis]
MSFGKLYSFTGNARTTALLAVAKANALDVEILEVKPQSEEVLKEFPLGKVPGFIGADGLKLTECNAIAIYFASQNQKTTLLGKTKGDYAQILQWLSFANTELLATLAGWLSPLRGMAPYNKKAVEEAEANFEKRVSFLEQILASKTFLVGERLTLADLVVAAHLARGFEFVFDPAWRSAHPNTTRYFTTIVNQHIYKNVAADVPICEEAIKYTAPKKEAAPKKEKEAAKPKAAAAAAAQGNDEEDEPVVEQPKAKHPLEALGKPKLAIDEWKRTYSNKETREEALPWFWKQFEENKADYSLWKVDYKYNDELTLPFMSANLVGGFFSRLEGSRKYGFGCASVYGTSGDSLITGAFFIRGQEYKPFFEVAPDMDSYEFTKLDASKDEDKTFVEDQWSWDKEYQGKEHADGKVFK